MITTPNMGLVGWDLGQDPYDHIQLAGNFTTIDQHDHSPGKGVRIGTSSIQDASITTPKIADNSITSAKIPDGTIQKSDIDPSVFYGIMPLGLVAPWWRADNTYQLPFGWAICDGTAWASIANDLGLTTGTIPDLRNSFVLGAATSGTGTTTTVPPAIGAQGGSHTQTLTHSHTVNAHTHTIPPHSHVVNAHSHNVSPHVHRMDHKHYFVNPIGLTPLSHKLRVIDPRSGWYLHMPEGGAYNMAYDIPDEHHGLVDIGPGTDNNANILFVQQTSRGYKIDEPALETQPVYDTDSAAPGTDAQAPGTNAVGLTTDNTGGSTGSSLGTIDARPKYTGLLYIMKVKY